MNYLGGLLIFVFSSKYVSQVLPEDNSESIFIAVILGTLISTHVSLCAIGCKKIYVYICQQLTLEPFHNIVCEYVYV